MDTSCGEVFITESTLRVLYGIWVLYGAAYPDRMEIVLIPKTENDSYIVTVCIYWLSCG